MPEYEGGLHDGGLLACGGLLVQAQLAADRRPFALPGDKPVWGRDRPLKVDHVRIELSFDVKVERRRLAVGAQQGVRNRELLAFFRLAVAIEHFGVADLDGVHAHDLGTILDRLGVAVRVVNHCAEPVIDRFGGDALARASFGLYNTRAEVDTLAAALIKAQGFFA